MPAPYPRYEGRVDGTPHETGDHADVRGAGVRALRHLREVGLQDVGGLELEKREQCYKHVWMPRRCGLFDHHQRAPVRAKEHDV